MYISIGVDEGVGVGVGADEKGVGVGGDEESISTV